MDKSIRNVTPQAIIPRAEESIVQGINLLWDAIDCIPVIPLEAHRLPPQILNRDAVRVQSFTRAIRHLNNARAEIDRIK